MRATAALAAAATEPACLPTCLPACRPACLMPTCRPACLPARLLAYAKQCSCHFLLPAGPMCGRLPGCAALPVLGSYGSLAATTHCHAPLLPSTAAAASSCVPVTRS